MSSPRSLTALSVCADAPWQAAPAMIDRAVAQVTELRLRMGMGVSLAGFGGKTHSVSPPRVGERQLATEGA
jgi:hypothetical protein